MKKIMFNDRYGLTSAVLEGRKTMTRRIVPEKLVNAIEGGVPGFAVMESKYKVGEVVAVAQRYKDIPNPFYGRVTDKTDAIGWNNKMFVRADLMPHQIRITGVRIERLQDISDEDCIRAGVFAESIFDENDYCTVLGMKTSYTSPREAFAALIDRVSGKGTWMLNPWVYVYEFELVK